jgi:hypothetical protein
LGLAVGALTLGEPLTYGEVSRPALDSREVAIRLFALDKPRRRMTPGAPLTLRDVGTGVLWTVVFAAIFRVSKGV